MFLNSSGNCKTALKEGRSLPLWGTPSLVAADVLPPDCFDKRGENMAFWGYMLAEGFLGLRETHLFAKEGFFFSTRTSLVSSKPFPVKGKRSGGGNLSLWGGESSSCGLF